MPSSRSSATRFATPSSKAPPLSADTLPPTWASLSLRSRSIACLTPPTDKIVFDVSHQTYAHKALTGRAYTYIDPARYGEASGFANPDESEHDLFAMGTPRPR